MSKKAYNTIQDFLNDESFKNWALDSRLSDVSFWNRWLQNNPSKKSIAYEAKDIIIGINFKQSTVSKNKVDLEWTKLSTKLKEIKSKEQKTKIPQKKSLKYTIAISAILLISFISYTYFQSSLITHQTAYGEVLELKLKDGTLVTLNSNSSISYNQNNPRKVELKGEAYFDVNKKETTNAKFWVYTSDLTVEVYGTQFNVKTSNEKTNVYLEEGKIFLSFDDGNYKQMEPGNYIEYSSEDQKIIVDKERVSNEEQTSWKNGTLIFDHTTLAEALQKVSDTYGVFFEYETPEIKEILITGTVPTTNLEICLNAIKKSINVDIKKENSILVVSKN
ncbi:FecR family protein [Tenacibaculum amylolyticum]|uniref:FecR family protein n=1 Tax=Tenacibaculum amylolyticum TaxID=104269 RepID=UPI00389601A4